MFDYYIAVDWAQKNMAIARMTKSAKTVSVIDVAASIDELKVYLEKLIPLNGFIRNSRNL